MVFCLVHDVFAQHVLEWAGSGLSMHGSAGQEGQSEACHFHHLSATKTWQVWNSDCLSLQMAHQSATMVPAAGTQQVWLCNKDYASTFLCLLQELLHWANIHNQLMKHGQLLIRLNKQRTLPAISRPDHVFRLRSSRIPDHQSLKQDSVVLYMCYIVNYFNWTFWILRLTQV